MQHHINLYRSHENSTQHLFKFKLYKFTFKDILTTRNLSSQNCNSINGSYLSSKWIWRSELKLSWLGDKWEPKQSGGLNQTRLTHDKWVPIQISWVWMLLAWRHVIWVHIQIFRPVLFSFDAQFLRTLGKVQIQISQPTRDPYADATSECLWT